jgi:hypothetical protein
MDYLAWQRCSLLYLDGHPIQSSSQADSLSFLLNPSILQFSSSPFCAQPGDVGSHIAASPHRFDNSHVRKS